MAAATKKTPKATTKPTPAPAQAAPQASPTPEPKAAPQVQPAAQPAPVAVVAVNGGTPTDKKPKAKPAKKFADIDVKAVQDSKIKVLTRNPDGSIRNPKVAKGAPAKRFAKYADGQTVAQALAAGVTDGDIRWDVAHEYIALQ